MSLLKFLLGGCSSVGDFSKEMGKNTIHQTVLVFLEKSYVVSFTLIGASEDEVNGLIEGLSFVAKKVAR